MPRVSLTPRIPVAAGAAADDGEPASEFDPPHPADADELDDDDDPDFRLADADDDDDEDDDNDDGDAAPAGEPKKRGRRKGSKNGASGSGEFKCPTCEKVFSSAAYAAYSLLFFCVAHGMPAVDPGAVFPTHSGMKYHVAHVMHMEDGQVVRKPRDATASGQTEAKNLLCIGCGKVFKTATYVIISPRCRPGAAD